MLLRSVLPPLNLTTPALLSSLQVAAEACGGQLRGCDDQGSFELYRTVVCGNASIELYTRGGGPLRERPFVRCLRPSLEQLTLRAAGDGCAAPGWLPAQPVPKWAVAVACLYGVAILYAFAVSMACAGNQRRSQRANYAVNFSGEGPAYPMAARLAACNRPLNLASEA